MIKQDPKINQLSKMRNIDRLMYLNEAQEQAELSEKYFTYNNAQVKFATGKYQNYTTVKP